jgi:TonB family protein
VTGSTDGTARVWDAQSGKELLTLSAGSNVMSVAFSPNGKCIVTGSTDDTARVWDAQSGKELLTLSAGSNVMSVAFSPNGKCIVTGNTDAGAKIWDAQSGKELLTLSVLRSGAGVNSVAFSPDGTRIVIGIADGTAKVWEFNDRVTKPATLNIASITKDQPYFNSLAMKFVPVPGTNVLFSIWETRVKDYKIFAEATKREWPKPTFEQNEEHPAVNVSWDDATAFCEWLTEQERKAGRISANQVYRLPTDLEWSDAVGLERESGGTPKERNMKTRGVYPWGTEWPPPKGAGNYDPSLKVDSFEWTSPVGSFEANRYGIYDLGGNVWEWCQDWFDGEKKKRVWRGASWGGRDPLSLHSSFRAYNPPEDRHDNCGFRCVLSDLEIVSTKDEKSSGPLESLSPSGARNDTGAQALNNADTSPMAELTGSDVKILSAPQPPYPHELEAKHIGGSGRFEIDFDESGNAKSVQTIQSTGNRLLDSNTVHTFMQWRASPGSKSKIVVPITYAKPKSSPRPASLDGQLSPPRPARLRRCRIISFKKPGELLTVRKGPGANFPVVARYSFHQNDLIRAGEGSGQRSSNAGTTWHALYSASGAFIGWVEEGYLSDEGD